MTVILIVFRFYRFTSPVWLSKRVLSYLGCWLLTLLCLFYLDRILPPLSISINWAVSSFAKQGNRDSHTTFGSHPFYHKELEYFWIDIYNSLSNYILFWIRMPPNQRRAFPTMDDSAISLTELTGHKEITLQNDMRVSEWPLQWIARILFVSWTGQESASKMSVYHTNSLCLVVSSFEHSLCTARRKNMHGDAWGIQALLPAWKKRKHLKKTMMTS